MNKKQNELLLFKSLELNRVNIVDMYVPLENVLYQIFEGKVPFKTLELASKEIIHIEDIYNLKSKLDIQKDPLFHILISKKNIKKNIDSLNLRSKISLQQKTVENILNGIEESKKQPFDKVLFALGIRYVGETVAKKLANHFSNIDYIIKSSYEELISASEVGDKIAKSIVNFFSHESNIELVNRLKSSGLNFTKVIQDASSQILISKTFLVTGTLQNKRSIIEKLIEDNGGLMKQTVTKDLSYLIVGDSPGSKLDKAIKLGIKTISENDFMKLLKD